MKPLDILKLKLVFYRKQNIPFFKTKKRNIPFFAIDSNSKMCYTLFTQKKDAIRQDCVRHVYFL